MIEPGKLFPIGESYRVDPSSLSPRWDDARRRRHLLRVDVAAPLSLDYNVWPEADGGIRIGFGLVISEGESAGEIFRELGLWSPRPAPKWPDRVLGYDVANGRATSGLTNCGYDAASVDALRSEWAPHINEHGLLATPEAALAFRKHSDVRVPAQGPFLVFCLWLHG